ncbi:DsrE family protein [Thioalkalivibrio sp. ALE9]|uniref:DsrE family protein n=1 Tax=Thioalkalivibrio sp. ALE9 TaxID=1158169 RepID=UPI00037DFBFF|nr:DsrE family protein [Thioalkalivibrio sp. ALE9]
MRSYSLLKSFAPRSGGLVALCLCILSAMPALAANPPGAPEVAPAGEPSAAVLELLERDERPAGVVFEIIENDRAALAALLPEIRANIARLREDDPDFPVAIVAHGAEQFTLTRREAGQHPGLHAEVEALVRDEDVSVAVCGTFADWRGIEADAFADFVEVADLAPDRLDDYRALGFEVIRLRPSLLDAPEQDPWQFDFGNP